MKRLWIVDVDCGMMEFREMVEMGCDGKTGDDVDEWIKNREGLLSFRRSLRL